MSPFTAIHPYDTRRKHEIRPSVKVQKQKNSVKKPSKKKGKGSQPSDDTQLLPQEPIEIASNTPSPLPLDDNAASTEAEIGEMDSDIEVETGTGANTATIYNNPQLLQPTALVIYGTDGLVPGMSHPQYQRLQRTLPTTQIRANRYIIPPRTLLQISRCLKDSYPGLGEPVLGNENATFVSSPHINYTILTDANVMAQDLITVFYSHSFEAEQDQTLKKEMDHLPGEGLDSPISWESCMSISSLDMDTTHGYLWSPMLSDPFSSVSGVDMSRLGGYILGEVGLEQIYSTSSPSLEEDEQGFSEAAEAMRMQTLVPDPDRFGLQKSIRGGSVFREDDG